MYCYHAMLLFHTHAALVKMTVKLKLIQKTSRKLKKLYLCIYNSICILLQEMTPEDALNWCHSADQWQAFTDRVTESMTKVNISILSTCTVITSDSDVIIDRRYIYF